MPELFGDPPPKRCCCGGDCRIGCCWPITLENPLYPEGALAEIPFDLDGCSFATLSGTFRPVEPGTLSSGICGPCGGYRGDWAGVVVGKLKIPAGMCMDTPCSVSLCLVLECVRSSDITGIDQCCSHIRLWVGASESVVNEDPDGPPANLSIGSCGHWIKVAPTACVCDEVGGLSALFDINIAIQRDVHQSGPCAGQPVGCQIECQTLQLTI